MLAGGPRAAIDGVHGVGEDEPWVLAGRLAVDPRGHHLEVVRAEVDHERLPVACIA